MNVDARMRIALALMGRDPAWLVHESGLRPSTIEYVLSGHTRTPTATRAMERVAGLLGVPSAWLFADTPQRQLTETEHAELLQCVQTIRALAQGLRIDARAKPNVKRETRRVVPRQFRLRGAREVYRVEGISMSRFGLLHGDLVYIRPLTRRFLGLDALAGSFVVFRLNDTHYLKQFTVATDGIVFHSACTGYAPITAHSGDKVELLGRVVASVREFV
jgi:SOS-response transcriptional repressor LexA